MKLSVFDAHCDTISRCLDTGEHLSGSRGMVDLNRTGAAFDRYCQFFALYADCGAESHPTYEELLACFRREMARSCGQIAACTTASQAIEANRAGKAAAFLTVEGGELLNCDPERLPQAAADGVVAINLTWNHANALSGSHCDNPRQGLTEHGVRFLDRMGELGILADVSHLSDPGFWDVAERSRLPVIASHSNARSICGHTRNLTDEQITAIIKSGGVIGLNFFWLFLGLGKDLDAVRAHLDHILDLGGAHAAALGGDWDGCDPIAALPDITALASLYEHLLAHGYGETLLHRLFYQNLMDVVSKR